MFRQSTASRHSTASPLSITDLPQELLISILLFLPETVILRSFSLVHSAFHRAAEHDTAVWSALASRRYRGAISRGNLPSEFSSGLTFPDDSIRRRFGSWRNVFFALPECQGTFPLVLETATYERASHSQTYTYGKFTVSADGIVEHSSSSDTDHAWSDDGCQSRDSKSHRIPKGRMASLRKLVEVQLKLNGLTEQPGKALGGLSPPGLGQPPKRNDLIQLGGVSWGGVGENAKRDEMNCVRTISTFLKNVVSGKCISFRLCVTSDVVNDVDVSSGSSSSSATRRSPQSRWKVDVCQLENGRIQKAGLFNKTELFVDGKPGKVRTAKGRTGFGRFVVTARTHRKLVVLELKIRFVGYPDVFEREISIPRRCRKTEQVRF